MPRTPNRHSRSATSYVRLFQQDRGSIPPSASTGCAAASVGHRPRVPRRRSRVDRRAVLLGRAGRMAASCSIAAVPGRRTSFVLQLLPLGLEAVRGRRRAALRRVLLPARTVGVSIHLPVLCLAVADLNGDGNADVVTGNQQTVRVLFDDGNRTFAAPSPASWPTTAPLPSAVPRGRLARFGIHRRRQRHQQRRRGIAERGQHAFAAPSTTRSRIRACGLDHVHGMEPKRLDSPDPVIDLAATHQAARRRRAFLLDTNGQGLSARAATTLSVRHSLHRRSNLGLVTADSTERPDSSFLRDNGNGTLAPAVKPIGAGRAARAAGLLRAPRRQTSSATGSPTCSCC